LPGEHNTFKNSEGRIIVIPDHGGQVIVRPLLRKLLRDMGISVDEYHKILKSSRIHKAGGRGEVWEAVHGNKQ